MQIIYRWLVSSIQYSCMTTDEIRQICKLTDGNNFENFIIIQQNCFFFSF